tara:strand:+ start:1260 stop:2339 length:1080 start_codon:yes stop_codon:yes gene_type:complete
MKRIKYLQKRTLKGGGVSWVVNPSEPLRNALFVVAETYSDMEDAIVRCKELDDDYKKYQSGKHPTQNKDENTVAGFIQFYKTLIAYENLKPNSKVAYEMLLRQAILTRVDNDRLLFGEMLLRNIDSQYTEKLYKSIRDTYSLHRATHIVKVLRRVFNIAYKHKKVRFNPFALMGIKGLPPRVVLWETHHVSTFINTSDELGLSSVGTLALFCYDLCQRVGDMRKLKWKNVHGNNVRFVQEKTGVDIDLELSPRLIERLSKINRGDPEDHIIICETTGNPYRDTRLYAKYTQRVRIKAGLPKELKLSDLRRTGATEMAESGCTEDELRSVTGHLSRNILSVYVRPTKKLAEKGMAKRFGC